MCYTEAEQVFHDFPEKCGKTEGLFHRKGAASCLNARKRPGNYSLCPFRDFALDETGVGVIELVLILVVLVSLVIVFKKQINTLLENIFKQINTKSKEVY